MRTLLTINIAVLISLMFAPHRGLGFLRFGGYAHGPFFIQPSLIDGKQLVLPTIFIEVVFVLIVNIVRRSRTGMIEIIEIKEIQKTPPAKNRAALLDRR